MAKSSSKEAKGEAPKKAGGSVPKYKREGLPRLRSVYQDQVRKELQEEFGYKNVMEIPRLVKITLNMGLGRAVAEPKLIDSAVDELRAISGRQPVVTVAKRDIATFKLRRGHKIGCMVTLRAEAMWEFLDRFVSIALPRVRDFRGVSPKAFDGRGNYSVGIREQIIFPEIDFDKVDVTKGLNITIVTTAKTDAEARSLLKRLGMPFRQPSSASAAASQGAQA